MSKHSILFLLLLFTLQLATAQKTAFKNVHVITMAKENEVLKNQTVLIQKDRIVKIGNARVIDIPKEYTIIDGKGQHFLMPGMMDNHAHLPLSRQGLPMSMDHYLTLQMVNGVTSVRCCRFEPEAMSIRDSLESNNILAPRLYLSSPVIAATASNELVFDYTNAHKEIPRFKSEGYDFVKLLSGLNPATHKGMMDICNEHSMPVVGHLPRSVGLDYAIVAKQKDIEHFQGYVGIKDEMQLDSFIIETTKAGIYNCPTIFWYDANYPFLAEDYLNQVDGLAYIDPELKNTWAKDHKKYWKERQENENAAKKNERKDILKRFANSDAKLLLGHGDGDYCIPGFGLLEEAKIFRDAGIDNYRILQAACSYPAEFFEEGEDWGKIKENYLADLILLTDNPLANIENLRKINGVMLQGKWIGQEDIEKKLLAIKDSF